MVKQFCISLSIIFSFIAFAELTKINGWEMATTFQRICILWSIGVFIVMIHSQFIHGGKHVFRYSRWGDGVLIRIFGYGLMVVNRMKTPPPFSIRNCYVKELRIGRYSIKFLRKDDD